MKYDLVEYEKLVKYLAFIYITVVLIHILIKYGQYLIWSIL